MHMLIVVSMVLSSRLLERARGALPHAFVLHGQEF